MTKQANVTPQDKQLFQMTKLDNYCNSHSALNVGETNWRKWQWLEHIFFFFYFVVRPFQDYFSSYETGKLIGGAKMGEPRGKPPGTPACRTCLVSHVASAGLEPTPYTAVRCSTALLTARPWGMPNISFAIFIVLKYEPPRGKTNNVVSEQVRHKPACTSTEKS